MMNRRSLLALLPGLGLGACVTPGMSPFDITMPAAPDDPALPAGTGVVVACVNLTMSGTPVNPPLVTINPLPSSGFAAGQLVLTERRNFRVVIMKAGWYEWRQVFAGAVHSYYLKDSAFDCAANAVTYVGDMDLDIDLVGRRYRIGFADRSEAARSSFAAAYPRLSAARPLSTRLTGKAG